MNNPFAVMLEKMYAEQGVSGYAPGYALNLVMADKSKICDHPKYDPKSVLKYKAVAYCNKVCPLCHSEISIEYENVCGGFGEYYKNLMIRCDCGLSFIVCDDKSIDLWNSVVRE